MKKANREAKDKPKNQRLGGEFCCEPDRLLKSWLAAVPATVWAAVLSALVFGVLVHFQSLSGFILNWDSAKDSFLDRGVGTGLLGQGKWLHPILVALTRSVSIGSANGLSSIFFLALSAGVVAQILELKSPLFSALTGMVMVSFPSVMSSFAYAGEDKWYMILLLTCLSVYWTAHYKKGFIAGIIGLTLSLGYYQAFIGFAAALFVFLCMLELLRMEKTEREIIKTGLKYVAVLVAAIAAYYVVLQLALHVTNTSLADYRGIDSALGGIDPASLLAATSGSYVKVLRFFWFDAYGRAFPRDIWAYRVLIITMAATLALAVVKTKLYRKPLRLILLLALVLVMPLAVHAIGILGRDPNTHWIMIYSFVAVFLFAAKLAEFLPYVLSGKDQDRRKATALQWVAIGALAVILINWSVTANTGYARLKTSFEGAYANSIFIMQEVLSLPDYSPDKPLAVIGKDQTFTGDVFSDTVGRFTGIASRNFMVDNTRRTAFIRDYIGIKLTPAPQSKNTQLARSDEFKAMPCYPAPGFAKVIDGYLVVKLSDI